MTPSYQFLIDSAFAWLLIHLAERERGVSRIASIFIAMVFAFDGVIVVADALLKAMKS